MVKRKQPHWTLILHLWAGRKVSRFEKSRPGHTVGLSKRTASFTRTPSLIAQGSQTFHNLPLPWKHPDFGWPDEMAPVGSFSWDRIHQHPHKYSCYKGDTF